MIKKCGCYQVPVAASCLACLFLQKGYGLVISPGYQKCDPCLLSSETEEKWKQKEFSAYCDRISSVVRALDCRAGDREFNSWDWNNTQGLKLLRYEGTFLCQWLDLCVIPSQVGAKIIQSWTLISSVFFTNCIYQATWYLGDSPVLCEWMA